MKKMQTAVTGALLAALLSACGGTDVADPGDAALDSSPTESVAVESSPEDTEVEAGEVQAKVEITKCSIDPDWGVEMAGNITNPLDVRADLAGVVEVLNADGDRVDESWFFVEKVGPGQKVNWDSTGFETEGLPKQVTCSLLDATAVPSE